MQGRIDCHDVESVSFGVPPLARGCTAVAASTLRQVVCVPNDFQQRTAWVAARLSAQSTSARGTFLHYVASAYCCSRAAYPFFRSSLRMCKCCVSSVS